MAKMLGAEEFCSQEPHFEGEKVFGSRKRKADIPLGSEYESYRPDRFNFSCLQVRTRSTGAGGTSYCLNDISEEPSPNLQEHPIPIDNSKANHMTAIQETE
jgi:hypothetical protein